MNYTRQYLTELALKTNFIKDNLEKALRLSEILRFLNNEPNLKGKLVLKGGTAINFTSVDLPRLSIDIDLDFTELLSKEEIEKEKNKLSKRLTDYMWQEGYSLNAEPRRHYALLSFSFAYINNVGNRDSVKVEINFMDRCHILPLEHKKIMGKGVIDDFEILVLNATELYASKINALLSRTTPRDLYDVNTMINNKIIENKELLRKCLVFYNMVGGDQDIDNVSFKNVEGINFMKFKTQLRPVLSKDDKFNLEEAKTNVISFLRDLITIDQEEQRFIDEFRAKNYMPELLFSDKTIVDNIKHHPMALWRCQDKFVSSIRSNKAKKE